jgi:hypothetical protein
MHGIMTTVSVYLASSDVVASNGTEGELMHTSSWWQLKVINFDTLTWSKPQGGT